MIEHGTILNRFRWMWDTYPFEPGETCCFQANPGFVDAVWEALGPLLGGCPVAIPTDDVLRDHARLVRWLADMRVSRFACVPSFIPAFLETCPNLAAALPDIRHWEISGEYLPDAVADAFVKAAPGVRVLNRYGSTEATSVLFEDISALGGERPTNPRIRIIANTRLSVLDRHGQTQPIYVPGELHISGLPLARGYLKQPDLTRERFVDAPIETGENCRLYRTGDIVRRLENGLEFLGRSDDLVKIRGYRVEIMDVETAVSRLPDVRQAAVICLDAQSDHAKLAAFMTVRRPVGEAVGARFRGKLESVLPEYMIPAFWYVLDQMPLNGNGKLDRLALRTMALNQPGESEFAARSDDPLLDQVLRAWQTTLGASAGADDDFFAVGGDSLSANRLAASLRSLGVRVSLRDIFECFTPAALAARFRPRQTVPG